MHSRQIVNYKFFPTLLTLITMILAGVGYIYSLDKRVSVLEADKVNITNDISEVKERSNRIEDKLDKIYTLMLRDRSELYGRNR